MKRLLVSSALVGLILLAGCGKSDSGAGGSGWSGFDPENGKFTVAMPGTPKEEPLKNGTGKKWTSSADGLTYSVLYEELNIPAGAADTDQAETHMDEEVNTYEMTSEGIVRGEKKPLMVSGLPGREVIVEIDKNTNRRIRMCISGKRLYEVVITGPRDKVASTDADSFLDSFRLGK